MNALEALKRLKEETIFLYYVGSPKIAEVDEWFSLIEEELKRKPTQVLTKKSENEILSGWANVKEISELYGYAPSTVTNYLKMYDIETKKEYSRRLINIKSFEKFMLDTGRMEGN